MADSKLVGWRYRFEKFMAVYAVLSHTWLLIQTIQIYSTKDVSSLSIVAFILLLVNSVMWGSYAAYVLQFKNKPLLISACVSFCVVIVALVGIILYSDSDETKANSGSRSSTILPQ